MKKLESRAMKEGLPFEFNKLYELWINSEYIPLNEDTINIVIKSIITEYVLSGRGEKVIDAVSLLNDIEWQWMTNRGSLSKRIGKWLKQHYDIAITSELSTAIGNTARKFLLKDQTYYFDFTDKVTWQAGDFGDHNSCFWEGSRSDHDILERISNDETMCAIRLFKQYSTASGFSKVPNTAYYANDKHFYKGISRAWMSIDKHKDSRIYTVFNGYGLTTTQIAALVSSFLGMSAQRLILHNNGAVEDDLYINSFGMAIGDDSIIKNLVEYDINLSGCGSFYEEKIEPRKSRPSFLTQVYRGRREAEADTQSLLVKNLRGKSSKAKKIIADSGAPFDIMLNEARVQVVVNYGDIMEQPEIMEIDDPRAPMVAGI